MKLFVTAVALLAVLIVGFTPAFAEDCVDVELGIDRLIPPVPVLHFEFFLSVVNCGSEAALVNCLVTAELNGIPAGTASFDAPMEAGQEIRIDRKIPINPNIEIPAGTCRLCLTVTSGTATDTSCATIVIDGDGNVLSFTLEGEDNPPAESLTWGAIKSIFR